VEEGRVAVVLDGVRGVEGGSECVFESLGKEIFIRGKWVERELFLPWFHSNRHDQGKGHSHRRGRRRLRSHPRFASAASLAHRKVLFPWKGRHLPQRCF